MKLLKKIKNIKDGLGNRVENQGERGGSLGEWRQIKARVSLRRMPSNLCGGIKDHFLKSTLFECAAQLA